MSNSRRILAERPRQIVERVAEFIRQGDLEGVVSMFHPDCKIAMDPTASPVEGHDAVRLIFADFVAQKMDLRGTVTGELINGDYAILQGTWDVRHNNGDVLAGGTSTEVARRLDNGGWTYFIDCPIAVPEPTK
ncbi:MAG: nuclear transport factor 2 family protein [Pseudomonadota bacterium]